MNTDLSLASKGWGRRASSSCCRWASVVFVVDQRLVV